MSGQWVFRNLSLLSKLSQPSTLLPIIQLFSLLPSILPSSSGHLHSLLTRSTVSATTHEWELTFVFSVFSLPPQWSHQNSSYKWKQSGLRDVKCLTLNHTAFKGAKSKSPPKSSSLLLSTTSGQVKVIQRLLSPGADGDPCADLQTSGTMGHPGLQSQELNGGWSIHRRAREKRRDQLGRQIFERLLAESKNY